MKIPVRSIFLGLCGLILFLLLMHHRVPIQNGEIWRRELYRFFDLNGEGNFPAWVSGSLLLSISQLSLGNYWLSKQIKSGAVFQRSWFLLFILSLFLSFDEVSGFHESLTYITKIKWVYLYFPFFIVMNILFFFALSRSSKPEKEILAKVYFGLLLFAGGGLFLEWIYFRFGPPFAIIDRFKFRLEEGLELLGITVALISVLTGTNYLLRDWQKRYDIY